MRLSRLGQIPGLLAACSLAACAWVLTSELGAFRAAVAAWAERDMRARTQLAADALGTAATTGDFRRLRAFGDDCRAEGVRLTVLSGPGGIVYDSATSAFGGHRDRPEVDAARVHGVGTSFRRSSTTHEDMFYCARRTGENQVVETGYGYFRSPSGSLLASHLGKIFFTGLCSGRGICRETVRGLRGFSVAEKGNCFIQGADSDRREPPDRPGFRQICDREDQCANP